MATEESVKTSKLHLIAQRIRRDVMEVAIRNGRGHIAPSLSCVDILVALFYGGMTEYDQFILSKAHGGYGYYAILTDKGILPRDRWECFNLPGCVERMPEYGIIAGCGSLGHGLPIASGIAFSKAIRKAKDGKGSGRVFCLIGDGEMQEGSNWEAIQFIVQHRLPVILIVDENGLQAMTEVKNVSKGSIGHKLGGFGMPSVICGSHPTKILGALTKLIPPAALRVFTLKGAGMPCAEGKAKFHYRCPPCSLIDK
jgi:transketolase